MKYSELSDDKKIARCTTPVLVSAVKNPDEETPEQVIENHERFLRLSFEAKYKLGFQYTPEIIRKIGVEFELDPLEMSSISRAIRSFYFGDIQKESIAKFLVDDGEFSQEKSAQVANIVVGKIIDAPVHSAPSVLPTLSWLIRRFLASKDWYERYHNAFG